MTTALASLANLREHSGCNILYSIKSLPLIAVLEAIKPHVDGFSVSSLFEARLAAEIQAGQGSIHLTTPGIITEEMPELTALCTHISGNSINQYQRLVNANLNNTSCGIRVNPKLSFTDDERHDPCRGYSKLGVDINELSHSNLFSHISGLHFHTVYAATDYAPLLKTVEKLRHCLGDKLAALDWLNLGGGYLFADIQDNRPFIELVRQLKDDFKFDIYIEPGNAIVGKAGYLLATVIDCFKSDGKNIAILDTSVNHHPQVFEYQCQPELYGHDPEGAYPVILAGSTCLAGDVFGEYLLNRPLQMGDRLVFKHIGAYSLVKANRFNGYNLPDVYRINGKQINQIKHYDYQGYRQQWLCDT